MRKIINLIMFGILGLLIFSFYIPIPNNEFINCKTELDCSNKHSFKCEEGKCKFTKPQY